MGDHDSETANMVEGSKEGKGAYDRDTYSYSKSRGDSFGRGNSPISAIGCSLAIFTYSFVKLAALMQVMASLIHLL